MRYLLAVILAAVLVFAGINVEAGAAKPQPKPTWNSTHAWIDTVWKLDRWQRGQPKQRSLRYYRWALRNAASDIDRKLIKRRWRKSKRAYYRHRSYCRSGMLIEGRSSYFSDGITASGMSAAHNAGLALNLAPGTESGWNNERTQRWMARARAGNPVYAEVRLLGRRGVFPIIDLGPAGWVGRLADYSLPAVYELGFTPANFPTDAISYVRILPSACVG